MTAFIYVITEFVDLLLGAILLFMFIRAVMSLFPVNEDSAIAAFIFSVTEPVILPVRALFAFFGLFEGFPIDISFFVSVLLLSLLRNMLP